MAITPSSISLEALDLDPAFALHRGGKLEIRSTVPVRNADDLALAYTPGVAKVCTAIAEEPGLVNEYTWVSNVVAVVSDGTAVLGLGDIGPAAAMPVMEGKALLFKQFAGVDAVPICIACTDVDEIVETVARLAPSFGGINLEDISAPRCFEVEDRLRELLDIPVFHDDQHGTAIVVLVGNDGNDGNDGDRNSGNSGGDRGRNSGGDRGDGPGDDRGQGGGSGDGGGVQGGSASGGGSGRLGFLGVAPVPLADLHHGPSEGRHPGRQSPGRWRIRYPFRTGEGA